MNTKPLKLRLLASEIALIANIAMREDSEQPLGQAIATGVTIAAQRSQSDSRDITPCPEHSGDSALCLTLGGHHLTIDRGYVDAARLHREEAVMAASSSVRVVAGPDGLRLSA